MTNPNKAHIASLIKHGARIRENSEERLLTMKFYEDAVESCSVLKANALVFDMVLPGINGSMALCIHRNGHVDSGTMTGILHVLDR